MYLQYDMDGPKYDTHSEIKPICNEPINLETYIRSIFTPEEGLEFAAAPLVCKYSIDVLVRLKSMVAYR